MAKLSMKRLRGIVSPEYLRLVEALRAVPPRNLQSGRRNRAKMLVLAESGKPCGKATVGSVSSMYAAKEWLVKVNRKKRQEIEHRAFKVSLTGNRQIAAKNVVPQEYDTAEGGFLESFPSNYDLSEWLGEIGPSLFSCVGFEQSPFQQA